MSSMLTATNSTEPPGVNPYLFEIEKRKKKAGLAHEWGQGAPCRCGSCPGLDLHFWRKICKSCKCRPEFHEVSEEEDPGKLRIGRLFDAPVKSRLEQLLFDSNSDSGGQVTDASKPTFASPLLSHGGAVQLIAENSSASEKNFEWTPPNIDQQMVDNYMAALPEEARPIANSIGAVKRKEAIERQLPLYDHDETECHELTTDERQIMTKYVEHFKQSAIGIGLVHEPVKVAQMVAAAKQSEHNATEQVVKHAGENSNDIGHLCETVLSSRWKCRRCEQPMQSGDLAVFAERAGTDVLWHPACFCCQVCGELLADLIYFYKQEDGNIYCGRHFGDSCFPRCAGCDELIFANEYTQAEDKAWHIKHFCCFNCDTPLGGSRYMFKQNRTFCLNCYAQLFARTCQSCCRKIEADVQRISQGDVHWHATSDCFFCQFCKKSLLGNRFLLKQDKIFCSKDCKINFFNHPVTCSSCGGNILASEERIEDGERRWHSTIGCFRCLQCSNSLIDKEYCLSEDHLFCGTQCLDAYQQSQLHLADQNATEVSTGQSHREAGVKQTNL